MTYYIITNRQIIKDPTTGAEKIDTTNDGITTNLIRFATFDSSVPGYDAYSLLPSTGDAHEQFFTMLYNDMADANGGDVLTFFHGFECNWACSIDNLRDMEAQHVNDPGSPVKHLVGISWPSRGELTHYPNDDKIAEVSGQTVGWCFNLLVDFFAKMFPAKNATLEPCNRKIHLLCHSMGNYVMQNMFSVITASNNHYYTLFEEIILCAADIDNDAFEQDAALSLYALNNLGRRIHIYTNRQDRALTISNILKHHKKRLGTDGPSNLNILPSHIYLIDATDVCTEKDASFKDNLIHHWYYKNVQKVADDISAVLSGQNDEDVSNRIKLIPGIKYRLMR